MHGITLMSEFLAAWKRFTQNNCCHSDQKSGLNLSEFNYHVQHVHACFCSKFKICLATKRFRPMSFHIPVEPSYSFHISG